MASALRHGRQARLRGDEYLQIFRCTFRVIADAMWLHALVNLHVDALVVLGGGDTSGEQPVRGDPQVANRRTCELSTKTASCFILDRSTPALLFKSLS